MLLTVESTLALSFLWSFSSHPTALDCVSMRSLRWVGDNWTTPFLSRIFPLVAHFNVSVPSVYPNFRLRDSNRWRSACSGLLLDTVHGRYKNIYGWGKIWETINQFLKMRKKSRKERWNNTYERRWHSTISGSVETGSCFWSVELDRRRRR